MNKIVFPLKLHVQGTAVADLQDALQLCLDRSAILASDQGARQELSAGLRRERATQTYGDATARLVSIFQIERRLQASGEMDETTANAINALLKQWGVLDQPTEPASPKSFVVAGQVRRDDGLSLEGVRARAVHESATAPAAAVPLRLGEDTTGADGRYSIRYESLPGVDAINLRLMIFDADGTPLHASDLIPGAKPLEIVDVIVPSVDIRPYRVEGRVASRISTGIGGLRVVIVDKGIGGDVQLAQATTNDSGRYQAAFSDSELRRRGKVRPDLQARVFAGDAFLGASDVHYNAFRHETLHVLLEDKAASALRSEHEVLTRALAGQFTGKLGDLKETDEQQDITYLANKTGWDARAVALAALADQFSAWSVDASGAPVIPQAFFYALFRAGLPANEDTLYHTHSRTLEAVWKKAAEQGVIPKASVDQIPNLIARFQGVSAQKLLTGPALIGASSLKELLTVSRLDNAQQARFAQLYAAHRADMSAFWQAAREAFGQEVENRLQVDGKLAFLTINNAPLMQKVHTVAGAKGLSDPLQLAQMGYHRAAPWSQLLTPDIAIPKEIPGETPGAKRANYANYLAAQVRLSYPTAAVAQMVKSGALPLTGAAPGVADQVHAFLTEHQGKFEIGVQPVEQYIAQNKLQLAEETIKRVVPQVKRLQRVYQITPSDQAMIGLMKRGVDAAFHLVRYDKDTFVQSFAADLGGADQAALTYDRSVQIHNVVLNIALSYLSARTAPAIGVHSPSGAIDPAPVPASTGDVLAYATLESLFGSMDFCACEHCRSILSPAAYFVDLLMFLDNPNPPTETDNPQTVLLERRPDIQHLPLTCENTNTALPYIDMVNETLEYYIANESQKQSLKDYQGHDTKGAASEDLLASPQFVMNAAYTTLGGECFPAPLPFHQPLENLRRYFDKFEVPLPLAMERLRKTDDLERGANPYGWRDILMEEIGLSRPEYEILTDSKAVPLWRMYGFLSETNNTDVIGTPHFFIGTGARPLSNAKLFSYHVGITYEELVEILKTRLINPHSDLIPKLEKLGVNFATLQGLKKGTITDADFDKRLADLAVPPDPAEYGNDIKGWVKNTANYDRIMGLITLAIPAGPWVKNQPYKIGDYVRPTKIQEQGSTLYYECATPTSAASEPKWSEAPSPGDTIKDGDTVVWICRDEASCQSFENLAFRYSDPDRITQDIGAVEFVRLMRFIRLWKKLGWTIEQTDAAICALYRADLVPLGAADIDTVDKLSSGFLTLLPRLGIAMRVMKALNLTVKRDLLPLLACWSDIGTHGSSALYRQMFLNPALLKQDAAFADNGYGEFLTNTETVAAHTEALRSAFNLTGEELSRIVTDLGFKILLEVPYAHPQSTLEQAILSAAPGIGYDDLKKQLSYAGVLSIPTREALKAVPGVSQGFKDAVDALYAANSSLTVLNIPNISAIFRRGWLARKLKLSVRELLFLIRFTGFDPFAVPDPANPAILRLIRLVQSMKDRSLKSAAALYLIWNQDLSGKSAPDPAQTAELARTLRGDFAGIDDQFAAMEDPNGDLARARMTLVYGQETSDAFFALLDDTLVVDVAYTHPADTLESAITTADPGISYDAFRHRLSHRGLMTTELQTKLNIPGLSGDFKNAVAALLDRSKDAEASFFALNPELELPYDTVASLEAKTQSPKVDYNHLVQTMAAITATDGRITYDNSNHRLVLTVDYTHSAATLEAEITAAADNRITYDNTHHRLSYAGVLTVARRDILKRVPDVTFAFQSAVDALFALSQKARGEVLSAQLSPGFARRRKRQQALQRLGATAGVDPVFTQTILDPATKPYPLHAAGDQNKPAPDQRPALDDMIAPETSGLAAQFFFKDTATGNPDQSIPAVASLDYASGGSHPLPNPGTAISGIWSGQVEAPEAGFYNFVIEADSEAAVTLRLSGQDCALTKNGNIRRNKDTIELKAGTPYEIELKVEKIKDVLSLKWETPKRAREVIPSRYLYPPSILEPFSSTYIRFLKAASLARGVGLTANELGYLATHSDYQIAGNGWLNALSVSGDPNTPTALLKPFEALLNFARIKAEISPSDESLLTVLKDPAAATNTDSLLFTITRWNRASLNDVLAQFGETIAGLAHFDLFRRVYDAFALMRTMGISAKAFIEATTNEPSTDTVGGLQAALRARYEASDWRDVVRPINDEMRSLQRDALVAYILHQMRSHAESKHIDTPDKLFEYFLMDVQMDPCMQTSRIRHALSSVQLFIERCLMNLEPRVSSEAINAEWWKWMKRYRVWEANRKVYLFPENWLEPELRDDQSPFFKETMSELLQGDITEERAAVALLNYLSKLEKVAKLEPCGIYHIPATDNTSEINHVVARAAGAYYYRRYEDGSWTPWEQIKLDIEDTPVIPVVWKDRLLLFWLRILKAPIDLEDQVGSGSPPMAGPREQLKGGPPREQQEPHLADTTLTDLKQAAKMDAQTNTQMKVQAVLCWSEYYNGKWQPTKTSDVNNPVSLGRFLPSSFDRSTLWLSSDEPQDGQLRISILGQDTQTFLLYNTHSLPLAVTPKKLLSTKWRVSEGGGKSRGMTFGKTFTIRYFQVIPYNPSFPRSVLTDDIDLATVQPYHPVPDAWDAPFFFEDRRNVFYVTTQEQPTWIPDLQWYGISADPSFTITSQIPPLVFPTQITPLKPIKQKVYGDLTLDLGFANPAPMQRLVTEDANIKYAIGTTGVGMYQGKQMGPSGVIANIQAEK